MEPAAKRARHGRAPHDDYADYAMPMDYNSKNTGVKKSKDCVHDGTENGDDGDDEDEIAMDPEDYAMKLNPQYRIQKSRAVADNKLKSAFELLFEKYSKDFGDTGDEINFYTDEIEVDNGHITSILAEEDVEEDDDEIDKKRNEKTAEDIGRGLSLLSTVPVLNAKEPVQETTSEPRPAVLDDDPVDPTWAAPTIPGDAFSTPNPPDHAIQPPRIAYSVPHRSIFRKSLPESFGKVASAITMGDNDDEDDVLMDTSEPILKFSHGEGTPRRRVSNWTGRSPGLASTASPSLPPASSLPADAVSGLPPPPSSILSAVPPPNTAAANPSSGANQETFSRNTMDPSFAFSDDEDFGLKRRNPSSATPKPAEIAVIANTTTKTPTTEKRRVGRPRIRPIIDKSERRPVGRPRVNPISEKKSARTGAPVRDVSSPFILTTPTAMPIISNKSSGNAAQLSGKDQMLPVPVQPPPQNPTPIPAQEQVLPVPGVAQSSPALPTKRSVGRPRRVRAPEDVASTPIVGTPTTSNINGQEVPFSSPQPMSITSTPSKPPTQEATTDKDPQSAPQPVKRRVGRPRKIRESEGVASIATDTPATDSQGMDHVPLSSPQSMTIELTPSKPPSQEMPEAVQSATQPEKRRVGRPRRIRESEGDSNTSGAAQGSPASGSLIRPASATPTSTPSKLLSRSPAQTMSPPLWQSVTQFQEKRRVGRPRKIPVVINGPADEEQPQPSQPSQELPLLPKSSFKPGRAEIPDSEATIPSSNTTTASTTGRNYGLRSSRRSGVEIPDSDANLSSSIIALVSDDDEDGGDDKNDSDSAVQSAISSQLVGAVGLGGTRLSPAQPQSHRSPTRSPSRLSPTRVVSSTPVTTARFVVIPRSGTGSPIPFGLGSGRASPLAKSVLRTPSPIKFSKSKLSSGTKLFSGTGGDTTADISPSGSASSVRSLVQTPGGTLRRCGQDGFRCEREFCFKCA